MEMEMEVGTSDYLSDQLIRYPVLQNIVVLACRHRSQGHACTRQGWHRSPTYLHYAADSGLGSRLAKPNPRLIVTQRRYLYPAYLGAENLVFGFCLAGVKRGWMVSEP